MIDKHKVIAHDQTDLEKKILTFHELCVVKQKKGFLPKPTFIGVGAGRCGTSTLYALLRAHPEIYLSPLKEVNYFGIRDKESTPLGLTFSEYLNYFLGAEEGQIIGEFSPAYLTYPASLNGIHKYLPDVKIIITVRDPYERFVSQFKHHSDKHQYEDLERYILDALKQYEAGWPNGNNWYAPVKNVYQSLYFDGFDYIFTNFKAENVIVVKQKDLSNKFESTMNGLMDFLGVERISIDSQERNLSSSDGLVLNVKGEVEERLRDLFDEDLGKVKNKFNIDIV